MERTWRKAVAALLAMAMLQSLCIVPVWAADREPFAQIGDTEIFDFSELDEIVNSADTPLEIIMLQSIILPKGIYLGIPQDKTILLNMNGQSITVDSDYEGRPIMNEGTLSVTGDGVIDSSASSSGGYGAINNKGTLTIENGTYRGAIGASGSSIRNTGVDAMLTINNGIFDGATCAVYNEGTAVIENGEFTGKTCSSCAKTGWSYTIRNDTTAAHMTINGGTFIGTQGAVSAAGGYLEVNDGSFKTVDCNNKHNAIFYALYAAGEVGEVGCVINGGTFETVGKNAAVLIGNDNEGGDGGINADAYARVYGGTFKAPVGVPALKGAAKTGDPLIYGGTFTSNPSPYLAQGHSVTETNGTYTVNPPTAQIGETPYASLTDAVSAAEAGDTIKVLTDVTLTAAIAPAASITFEGVARDNGTLPIITAAAKNGLFSLAKADVALTLKDLNLQTAVNDNWTIYHSAGTLAVNHCNFTMADGVTSAGNLIMGAGGANTKLVFTNNDVTVKSRVALTDVGNNSVITGNTIDSLADRTSSGRTSVISLTADAAAESVTVTGNTFKNANRVLAVDNAQTMPAAKLAYFDNRFIDVRYVFELGSTANKDCGAYDISKNYYNYQGNVSAPLVEDADAKAASHFDDTSLYTGTQVKTEPYYVKDAIGDTTALSNYKPSSGGSSNGGSTVTPPKTETDSRIEGDVKTDTTTTTTTNKDGSKTTETSQTVTNTATGEKTEAKVTETVAKDGSVTKEAVTIVTAANGKTTELKTTAVTDAKTGITAATEVVRDSAGTTTAKVEAFAKTEVEVNASGMATATVDTAKTMQLVEQAKGAAQTVQNAEKLSDVQSMVTIKAEAKADVKSVEVSVPKAAVTALTEGGVSVKIDTPNAAMTLDPAAMQAIAAAAGDANISIKAETVSVAALPAAAQAALSSAKVVDLTIQAAGESISSFDSGKATVALPYTLADSGKAVAVFYVAPDGKLIRVPGARYDEAGKRVSFSTGHFSLYAVAEETPLSFADVSDSDWYYDAVRYVTGQALFTGISETIFAPEQTMTREMLAAVLYRKAGSPAIEDVPLSEFTDGANISPWAADSMHWAVSQGFLTGIGGGKLDPQGAVTRQQMVVILHRAAGSPATGGMALSEFADGGMVSAWAQSGVLWAVENGVLSGGSDGNLNPNSTATRAEVAAMLMRSAKL